MGCPMRTKSLVLFTTTAAAMLLCTEARAQAPHQGSAQVLNADSVQIDTAVAGHKDYDVEVVRMTMEGPTVMFYLYRMSDGAVKRYTPFGASQKQPFVTATYTWTDDSTVVIRLQDARGNPVSGYRITGYKGKGSMQRLP